MIIEGLLIQSQNRSTGYISKRSRQQVLVSILPLIEDYYMTGRITFQFTVSLQNLKTVELALQRGKVAYRKVL